MSIDIDEMFVHCYFENRRSIWITPVVATSPDPEYRYMGIFVIKKNHINVQTQTQSPNPRRCYLSDRSSNTA